MPYGYGGANGPADWAAQQQNRQADNFNQIIRLFLSLKQAQQEEGWKQKEFGANQQRYDNSLAQQGVENKRAEAMFGLNKQNVEPDNARQAGEAKDRAKSFQESALNRDEDRAARAEQNALSREAIAAQKAAALAARDDSDSPGKIKAAYSKEKSIIIGRHQMKRAELLKAKGSDLSRLIFNDPKKKKEINDYYDDAFAKLDEDKTNAIGELDLTYGQGGTTPPPAQDKFKIGEIRKSPKDGKNYKYMGNDSWLPLN